MWDKSPEDYWNLREAADVNAGEVHTAEVRIGKSATSDDNEIKQCFTSLVSTRRETLVASRFSTSASVLELSYKALPSDIEYALATQVQARNLPVRISAAVLATLLAVTGEGRRLCPKMLHCHVY